MGQTCNHVHTCQGGSVALTAWSYNKMGQTCSALTLVKLAVQCSFTSRQTIHAQPAFGLAPTCCDRGAASGSAGASGWAAADGCAGATAAAAVPAASTAASANSDACSWLQRSLTTCPHPAQHVREE